MRFLRVPTLEPTDDDEEPATPAWIIDGLERETPRLEAPRVQLPVPQHDPEQEREHEERARPPAPSTVIIIDW